MSGNLIKVLFSQADPREIIFTSGATESNNIALKGVAKFQKSNGKNHIITVATVRIVEKCAN